MTPEMEPKLDYSVRDMRLEKLSTLNKMAPLSTPEVNKYQMTWMRTNPDVKPYKVMDDLTFVGIPVFAAGWIIKSEKNSFRQDIITSTPTRACLQTSRRVSTITRSTSAQP